MKSAELLIQKNNLIVAGDIIGVAVSGGVDSMSLLYYLNSISKVGKFKVVAINIDHGIRGNSAQDSEFVINYCNKNDIKIYTFKTTLEELTSGKKSSLELSARNYRYKIFEKLINDKKVTKVALGHHLQDQAETILLNIFRGAGLSGASGMAIVRDGVYIRPLLKTQKTEILAYASEKEIPFVEDETNSNHEYSRNYIRNLIMPLIRSKWKNADQSIANFGEIARQDDEYIYSIIADEGIIKEGYNATRIPLNYFIYPEPVISRVILKALKEIGVTKNLEKKHISAICMLASEGDNGAKISLPNKIRVYKEYNFITITNGNVTPKSMEEVFVVGKIDVPSFGLIETVRLKKAHNKEDFMHLVDSKKVSKKAVWRFKEDGDVFEKFGGGTKLLNDYLTDIKVPQRVRKSLPVLAVGNEILIVGGHQISEKLRLDDTTKTVYGINVVKFRY